MINHFGILVPELEAGIETYTTILGVPFCAPFDATFAYVDHLTHVEEPANVRLTYSMAGPAYIELIEATGDGVWSAKHGFGYHHFGGYVDDIEAATAAAVAQGSEIEAVIRSGDGDHMLTYFAPGGPTGARFELLTTGMLPAWETWVAGGPPPGH